MDREQQRKEISRKICERCDYFDGRACTVNVTGECYLAKESAESILAMGYGNEVVIDGKFYTVKQLQRYIKFYDEHQIEKGQIQCPLCECDYDENGLFVCDECGNLLPKEEKCTEHYDGDICQECCDECSRQKAFEDAVNLEIDRKRGK